MCLRGRAKGLFQPNGHHNTVAHKLIIVGQCGMHECSGSVLLAPLVASGTESLQWGGGGFQAVVKELNEGLLYEGKGTRYIAYLRFSERCLIPSFEWLPLRSSGLDPRGRQFECIRHSVRQLPLRDTARHWHQKL